MDCEFEFEEDGNMEDDRCINDTQLTSNGIADPAEWKNEEGEEEDDKKYRHLNVPLTPREISDIKNAVAADWADIPF